MLRNVLVHTDLNILVVEDDSDIAQMIADQLRKEGHRAVVVGDGDIAMRRLDDEVFDLLICDVRLPGVDGLTIFRRIKQQSPLTPVILMSAYGSIPEAVNALKNDATHYLAKPFGIEDLLHAVHEAEAQVGFERQRAQVQEADAGIDPEITIIGESPPMRALKRLVRTVARAEGAVLITGETGTGKERVARTIHALSRRRDRPFVPVNCAAFPDTLLEAELFGHERGAFTGALQRRDGRFRAAEGGTLFLDEVGETSPGSQAKLLRVLEDGTYQPLGSNATVRADVRTISATNVDLRGRIPEGKFRDDLYYRLKLFHLHVPPLRERRSDLPKLVEHFLIEITKKPELPRLAPRAWAALSAYDFPGNVRELRHAVQHAVAMAGETDIDLVHLPPEIRGDDTDEPEASRFLPLSSASREFERDYLVRALREAGWNKTRAAKLLGISRKTLWQKLRSLGVDVPRRKPR